MLPRNRDWEAHGKQGTPTAHDGRGAGSSPVGLTTQSPRETVLTEGAEITRGFRLAVVFAQARAAGLRRKGPCRPSDLWRTQARARRIRSLSREHQPGLFR